ncbi:hypothetical protein [Ruania alba]|uniref:hypothetical protein n=1 Tax=Ruania alba TaxID=648782 RepID=UPI0011140A31|nr:hypothetical protein [Ruania alba]
MKIEELLARQGVVLYRTLHRFATPRGAATGPGRAAVRVNDGDAGRQWKMHALIYSRVADLCPARHG